MASSSTGPFPSSQATEPYWRSAPLPIDNHRSTEALPAHADIVIIGAGYSGTSVAHHLLAESQRDGGVAPSIVILEARQACSGATGRNGGHLKPDPYLRAAKVLETHGKEVAEHVASFEARQIRDVQELARLRGIDCEFEEAMVSDVCLDEAGSLRTGQALSRVVAAGVSTAQTVERSCGPEAERVSGVRGAKSCLRYRAARLWPYRLVCRLLADCVAQGVNLQTTTPVTAVEPLGANGSVPGYMVRTPRGALTATKVVHATNGYSAGLLPELRDRIVPVRGVCARLVVEAGVAAGGTSPPPPLTDSYMLRFNDFEYDYLAPRPDGSVVVGGGRRAYFRDLGSWFGVADDGGPVAPALHRYFDGYLQRHFAGWEGAAVRTDAVWSGIMGYAADGFPYVGAVPARPGCYLCAGFTGHGMPQVFHAARHVAALVLGGRVDDPRHAVPAPYRTGPERWAGGGEHASLALWRSVVEADPGPPSRL